MKETVSKTLVNEKIVELENPHYFNWTDAYSFIKKQIPNIEKNYILKTHLVKSSKNKLYFNVVYLENFKGVIDEPFVPVDNNVGAGFTKGINCLLIPTGVGASFGGYGGDANPIAKLLSTQSKYLLTHPNVVNGAVLSDLPSNLIYLEGFLLDQYLLGKVNLKPKRRNKISIIFDKGISNERLEYEINVLNALKAYYGCEILGWTQTDKELVVVPYINDFGFSSGKVVNLECLVEKAIKLKELGATAIAVSSVIPDLELNKNYTLGSGIDPIGGIESIISHTLAAATSLVCAHAPVLLSSEKVDYKNISPVSASEFIAQTFLPSVISGLRFAPEITPLQSSGLSYRHLDKIIVPYNAFGSPGVLHLGNLSKNILLIKENKTCLNVDPTHLNIHFNIVQDYKSLFNLSEIKEYGIDVEALERPLINVKQI